MEKFDKLVDIIKELREPNGCPWDREQTLESLKPHLLEETYEVLEAMDIGGNHLKSELGDLLLQIIFQSQISTENKEFTIEDVLDSINEKMIRRHPHVFNKNKEDITTEEVLVNWEKIKSKEKEHQDRKSVLDGIPKGMTSLLVAEKMQKKASKVGFDWEHVEDVLKKVDEETLELKEEILKDNKKNIEEELGDLFFSLVNLSRHLNINPEICLSNANKKFEKRFKYVEKNCTLKEATISEMSNLWDESKIKSIDILKK